MKALYTVFIFLFSLSANITAQGIEFHKGAWADALAQAKEEKKIMFVDAYAEWCGPCKRMARDVFTKSEVGDFFNEQFINVKLDMEKGDGPSFGAKYPVSAYPTLIFIDGETGKIAHKSVGGMSGEKLIAAGKLAIKKNDKSDNYAKEYDDGNRDYDLVLSYVKALNTAEKPSLKISNEYLRSKPDITKEQRAIFLMEAVTEADTRLFDLMTQEKPILTKVVSEDAYYQKVEEVCCRTVEKAAKYESEDLLEEAFQKMKAHHPKGTKSFEIKSKMDYNEAIGKFDEMAKYCKAYFKKVIKDDPAMLLDMSATYAKKYKNNSEIIDLSEKMAERAVKIDKTVQHLVNYSKVLYLNKKKDKAIKVTEEAIEIAKKDGEPTHTLEGMIRYYSAE